MEQGKKKVTQSTQLHGTHLSYYNEEDTAVGLESPRAGVFSHLKY